MVARNDITGDAIQTKGTSQAFRDNYDNIFRKDRSKAEQLDIPVLENEEMWSQRVIDEENMQVRVPEEGKKIGTCGCGRSPTGDCIGWHGLTEEQFKVAQEKYLTNQEDITGHPV